MNTIAAISTPPGKGGVALIRISGDRAIEIASRVFVPANGTALSDAKSRTAVYGRIVMPISCQQTSAASKTSAASVASELSASSKTSAASGSAETAAAAGKANTVPTDASPEEPDEIDTGLCTLFRAPHSFTGEDTAEISCHGGALVTSTVLAAVLCAGARQALPGEFTRRAFLNGKMGLDAAEALGSLLDAKTGEQLRLSRAGMKGILGTETESIYRALTEVLSSVFACIDYPDEDLAEMSRDQMTDAVGQIHDRLSALAATWRTGRAIMEGIPTVLVGRTNAGKSSLYNLLAGHDAAIVTDIAGTTRDVLTETLSLGRVTLRLSDTAGIRETDDPVERIGVERALRALDESGLILAVFDASEALTEDDLALIARLEDSHAPVIAIRNKSDLCAKTGQTALLSAFGRHAPAEVVTVSAKTGEGLAELTAAVEGLFIDGGLDPASDAILMGARQYAAVIRARDAVGEAMQSLSRGLPADLTCDDLQVAMSALSELDGRAVSEDVVADIFARFCVGK